MPFTVAIVDGKKKTNPQNNTVHMWYAEAAKHLGENDLDVRAECKLIHGVPILRRDNIEFRADYDEFFRPLPHETKLRHFRLFDPKITSLMKSKQMTQYMEAMQRHYAEMGIYLTDPEANK
jgi:hypothetical protein